ncbi:probable prolyl 4-hydroxylase 6 [Zingiber officinale]|uniref:probable prolyl 4-hydroxylase 6 n=1 Tax=Zingiber officinale TaxID=94328 RepID=UPI001C4BD91F|nr:probable prolyl 4-hydroxylase 6 [Zingiber officinale]
MRSYASSIAFFFSALVLFLVSFPGLVPLAVTEPSIDDPSRVTQISWRPRIFLYEGFLSDEECDHIIKLARSKMKRSMVADNKSGDSRKSNVRTSFGTFLTKHQDEVIARIDQRIAKWTFLPEENAEALQVLRYQEGQKYVPHHDYFFDPKNKIRGGDRYATVLMYLSDVEKGGETVFPIAEGASSQFKDDSWSDCAKNGLAVKPKKGDAVLFFSLHINGTTDPASLHGSCPVIEGEKWSAPKWIHVRSYDNPQKPSSTEECSDYNENCSYWASTGECQKNPNYMIGNDAVLGNCRKSCMVCGKSKSMRLIS